MASLGLWNLVIIALATIVLQRCWKLNGERAVWQNSEFLKHPFIQRIIKIYRQPISKLLLQIIIILIVTRWLIYTGWVAYRLTQPNAPFWDFKQFYIVSNLVLNRENPYDLATYTNAQCQLVNECYSGAFIYPPNIIPFIWVLGYFSLEGASSIWVLIHLITIGLILWGAKILLASESRAIATACIIICALIYGLVFDLRVGNISSIVAALLVWSIIFARRNRDISAGILLGISTIKPTISGLFFLYFLLKRRWNILAFCVVTSLLLLFIGMWFYGGYFIETIQLYKVSYDWTFQNHPSGNPFLAPARIDLGVIGPRLFPSYPEFAKLLSSLLSLIIIFFVGKFIYEKQVINNWSKQVYLSEVTLLGCLSTLLFYAQRHTTSILVLAAVFFLNYLLLEIKKGQFSPRNMYLWSLGIICLLLQSGVMYFRLLEPLEVPWKNGKVPYFIQVSIGTLPNYTIFGLTLIILYLGYQLKAKHEDD